jgi:hypothetical protein
MNQIAVIDKPAPSKVDRYTKDVPCVVPGCDKKFRPTTEYQVFLAHFQKKHGAKS